MRIGDLLVEQANYNNWDHQESADYSKYLEKHFGSPDEFTNEQTVWHNIDGFKRVVCRDEYILHGSPAPHYDFVYSYIDLEVPEELSDELAKCSGSILIDHLKNEVGARCGSLTANAVTLNFCLDVVAGRTEPSKDEYEKRILDMKNMFKNGEKYELDWWPDEAGDADPENPYYNDDKKENVTENAEREYVNLEKDTIERLRQKYLPDWEYKDNSLQKRYKFEDYFEVIQFLINTIKPQEKLDHHADLGVFYDEVLVKVYTHRTKDVTDYDFMVAMQMDMIAKMKHGAINPNYDLNALVDEGTRCWKGYVRKGMKTMFGKRVPNCVKREGIYYVNDAFGETIYESNIREQALNFLRQNYIELKTCDVHGRLSEAHHSGLRAWFGKGKKGGAGGGGWDRYNTKGERIGKCGDRKKGEGKPKCLSKARAASLRAKGGKKAIASAVRRKRSKDKNPERRGKAINVSNKKKK